MTFKAGRPLQDNAFTRFKLQYIATYRVPKDIFRAKAIKELEKIKNQKVI